MTKEELLEKLRELKLEHQYSLDGSLECNTYVLYHNYAVWEYFLFDERGGRSNMRLFHSEKEAYDFIYQDALEMDQFRKKHGIKWE